MLYHVDLFDQLIAWVVISMSSSDTDYVLNEQNLGQYHPYAVLFNINAMLRSFRKFGGSLNT